MIPGLDILNLHAQGGMAEVYRARGKGADGQTWTYAVKRILPEFTADKELRKMFVEEARVASLLIHPNIVRVYDLARAHNDEYFIVMEFLEGRDLAEAIDKCHETGRTLPIWLAVFCARSILAALVYATEQATDTTGRPLGLIHRDISPHNVFVCFDGQVKLTDFGVAKVAQSSVHTQAGVTKGKFGYMSPEQLMSTGLDFRSDLYNVGILLYEVMTCQRLFFGENPSQFLQSMMRGHVPKLDVELGVPAELEALMRRALSKDRTLRPATAAAFDVELAAIQRRYGMPHTRARVEAEWRTLFGATDDESSRAPPASVPRRLASASAALPEVVARAEVPHVKGREDRTALLEVTDSQARMPDPGVTDPGEPPRTSPPRTGSSRPSGPRAVLLGADPWATPDDRAARAQAAPRSSPRTPGLPPASSPSAPRTPGAAPSSSSHPAARKVVPHGSRVVPLDSEEPKE